MLLALSPKGPNPTGMDLGESGLLSPLTILSLVSGLVVITDLLWVTSAFNPTSDTTLSRPNSCGLLTTRGIRSNPTEGLTPQLTTKIQPNSSVSCQDGTNLGHWFSVQLGKTNVGNVTLVDTRGEGTDDR